MLQRVLAICLGFGAMAAAQDPVQVSPDYKAEVENDWVRVLRVKRGPHDKAPMHQHPASVVVYLTDYHQKVTGAEGRVQELTRKADDVSYIEALQHSEEDLSEQPLE